VERVGLRPASSNVIAGPAIPPPPPPNRERDRHDDEYDDIDDVRLAAIISLSVATDMTHVPFVLSPASISDGIESDPNTSVGGLSDAPQYPSTSATSGGDRR
jgi:hypothetical protein